MLDLNFFPVPEQLAGHITSIYRLEVKLEEGERVTDLLLPEWSNIRMLDASGRATGSIDGVEMTPDGFLATGPSTKPHRFSIGTCRLWGFGMLPLGWASLMDAPASELANCAVDGGQHPAFAPFVPLARSLDATGGDDWSRYRHVRDWLLASVRHPRDGERIRAMQDAMADPYLTQIPEFAKRAGISVRTLERLSLKFFGFSPNVVLRRQRLVRSLASFMVDLDSNWSEVIDRHYHDQPHFVREFHHFMGMSPSDYAALDHPIMRAFMENRQRVWGKPARPGDRSGAVAMSSGEDPSST